MSFNTYEGPFAGDLFIEAALGSYAIGFLIQLVIYGVALSHLFVYLDSSHSPSDSFKTKCIVVLTLALATVQNSETIWNLYHRATWQGRDGEQILSKTLLDCLTTLAVGFEAVIVQAFLTEQASAFYKTRKSKIFFSVASGFGILVGFAGAIMSIASSFNSRDGTLDNLSLNRMTGIFQIGGAFSNIITVFPLIILLIRQFSEFNSNTEKGSRHLVYFSIIALSALAFASVVGAALCYAFDPASQYANVSAVFWNPLSSLYLLAVLTVLTARTPIPRPVERKFGNTGISVAISFVQHVEADRESGSITGMSGLNTAGTRRYRKPVGVTFDGIEKDIEKNGNLGSAI